ncbi:MAG: phosphoribosylformylglycinamidine synthase subunit PurS [Verrucomicrobiota bacterium]
MKAVIFVTLKPSVFDPQGEAVKQAMAAHGLDSVQSVRIGKRIEVELKSAAAETKAQLERISGELLSNPVIENYELVLPGSKPAPRKVAKTVKTTAKKAAAKPRKSAAASRPGVVPPKPVKPPASVRAAAAAAGEPVPPAPAPRLNGGEGPSAKPKAAVKKAAPTPGSPKTAKEAKKEAKQARKEAKKEKKAAKKAKKKLQKQAKASKATAK